MRLRSLVYSVFFCSAPLCAFDHWNAKTEFVYMRRSHGSKHSLVENKHKSQRCNPSCPNFSVLNTDNLVKGFRFEPGYRVSASYSPESRTTFEGTYMWIEEWEDKKERHGRGDLFFPFESDSDDDDRNDTSTSIAASDYTDADKARAKYESKFWTAELNYWHHFTPRDANYFSLAGLIGLRYFHLNEEFRLAYVKGAHTSDYKIDTKNHICAAQVGLDLQMNPIKRLSWDFIVKVGAFADWAKERVFLGDQNNAVELRHFHKDKWGPGIITDLSAQVGYQLFHFFEMHVGYEMIFLNGVALATGQIDDRDPFSRESQHKKFSVRNHMIVHGLFAGIDWKF